VPPAAELAAPAAVPVAAEPDLIPEAAAPDPVAEAAAPEVTVPEPAIPVAAAPAAVPVAAVPDLIPEAAAPDPVAVAAAPEVTVPEPAAPVAAGPEAHAVAPEAPEALAVAPEVAEPAASVPAAPAPAPTLPSLVAARFAGVERERPLPSVERALSGPGSRDEVSWRRQVKVVTGGQGPGKRDQETLDRNRARQPLAGPRRIAVLGCTRGAGQTVTALMIGHVLAVVRGTAIAALDLNPGATSLAARRAPAASVQALLAGQQPGQPTGQQAGRDQAGRLDVIADLRGNGTAPTLRGADFQRLADLLAERYPLTMIDPAPSGLTRVLSAVDQLVVVAPASPEAATSLANTQQWLGAHGYGELAARAVTVVNGVSRRTMPDVLRAESVARGRCRAIVRVPWDDLLFPGSRPTQTLHPQTKLAYTALAGVLIAGMSADPGRPVPGRNPGEHSD
jgi:MinD-like ATPase involved in chromosome partitioning or flagellar assembly